MKKKKVHFLAYAPEPPRLYPACHVKLWDEASGDLHNVTCLKCVKSKEFIDEKIKKIGEIIEKILNKPKESDEKIVEGMMKVLIPSAKSIKVKKIGKNKFRSGIVFKPVEYIEINFVV